MTLPEDSPPGQIISWFRDQGLELRLHGVSPPRGDASSVPRALRVLPRFTHWADLVSLETGEVVIGWCGGGMDEAQAVRSARARWRVEEERSPSPSES